MAKRISLREWTYHYDSARLEVTSPAVIVVDDPLIFAPDRYFSQSYLNEMPVVRQTSIMEPSFDDPTQRN